MKPSHDLLQAKKATQWVFLICGLGISTWAPMVPFAKERLDLDDGDLGFLLLLLGLGALIVMPISGVIMSRIGSRKMILAGTLITAFILPLLLIIPSYAVMGGALFALGGGVGAMDVAMNAHGVQVQNLYGRPVMSSLHGLYSVGGIFAPLGLGMLMKTGLPPLYAAIIMAMLLIALLVFQYNKLFGYKSEKQIIEKFSGPENQTTKGKQNRWLHKRILLLGFMCFAVFISEGAMLDWGAVFLREIKSVTPEFSGIGYAAFSVAMAVMRLSGDKIVEKLNNKIIVVGGSLIAALGLMIAVFSAWVPLVLFGFILVGVGASNIVPIFFSEGGRIPGIPSTAGIAAITTMGYAGLLAGPALLGYIAQHLSLPIALGFVALLMLIVAVIYGFSKDR